jgi:DNA-binding CsgD family transcriptional regulator
LSGSNTTFEGRLVPTLIVIFSLIALLMIVDVAADIVAGTAIAHIVLEAVIALIALAAVVFLMWQVVGEARAARRQAAELTGHLQETRIAAEEWRKEAQGLLQGLGEQIDRQFAKWGLSGAEKEVALFLLKGYSHRDISGLRQVSEATARQQARAVYKKAGVAGRHDLSAFFLEDLALPQTSDGD